MFQCEPREGCSMCSVKSKQAGVCHGCVKSRLLFTFPLTEEHCFLKGAYSWMLALSVAGQRLWETLARTFSSHFMLESFQSLFAPAFCRQGLQSLIQAIFSSCLHLKVKWLNTDRRRFSKQQMNVVYLHFEKVRVMKTLQSWYLCRCVWLHVCANIFSSVNSNTICANLLIMSFSSWHLQVSTVVNIICVPVTHPALL